MNDRKGNESRGDIFMIFLCHRIGDRMIRILHGLSKLVSQNFKHIRRLRIAESYEYFKFIQKC